MKMACHSRWSKVDENGEWESSELDSDDDDIDDRSLENSSDDDDSLLETRECSRRGGGLKWNNMALERIVLMLSERFQFRIEMNGAMGGGGARALLPSGLALAGGLVGRHLGGRRGAAVGGAIGGALGVGVLMVGFRDVWENIKAKAPELLDLVFDYLGGLGVHDYQTAIQCLTSMDDEHAANLALIILQVVREVLGKNVMSTLPGV